MPSRGLGEDALGVPAMALLRAVDVREPEHLAADGVADEARHVDVDVVGADRFAVPSGAELGDDGGRGGGVGEQEEEEAVAARALDHAVEDPLAFGVGVEAGQGVDEVLGDEQDGAARGLELQERRARLRRLDQHNFVDHRPRRARGSRGEAAVEAARGRGGGEGAAEQELHFGERRPGERASAGESDEGFGRGDPNGGGGWGREAEEARLLVGNCVVGSRRSLVDCEANRRRRRRRSARRAFFFFLMTQNNAHIHNMQTLTL